MKLFDFYKSSKLGKQLINWFVLFSLVPFALIIIITFIIASSNIKNEAKNNLKNNGIQKEKELNIYFSSLSKNLTLQSELQSNHTLIDSLSIGISNSKSNISDFSYSEYWENLFHEYKNDHQLFLKNYNYLNLFLIDNNGNILYSANRTEETGKNIIKDELKNREFIEVFNRVQTTGQMSFSDISTYKLLNYRLTLFAMNLIFNEKGEKLGVICIQVPVDEINSIINSSTLGETGICYLIGQDGLYRAKTRYGSEDDILRLKYESKLKESWIDFINNNSNINYTDFISYNNNGRKVVGVLNNLSYLNEKGINWALITEIEEKEIFKTTTQILLIAVLVLILVLSLVLFLSKRISSEIVIPILKISELSKSASKGEYITITNNDSHKKNEIRELKENFNGLIQSINEITEISLAISSGDLNKTIKLRSENDKLSKSINNMLNKLQSSKKDTERKIEYLNLLPLPIFVLDKYHNCIFINQQACIIAGKENYDCIGYNTNEIFNQINKNNLKYFGNSINNKIQSSNIIELNENGLIKHYKHTSSPLFNQNNLTIGSIEYLIDVSGEQKTIEIAEKISNGDFLIDLIYLSDSDKLSLALKSMISTLKEVTNIAVNVSKGDFSYEMPVRSENDYLSIAINKMIDSFKIVIKNAKIIADGNFNIDFSELNEKNELAIALKEMNIKLKNATELNAKQFRLKTIQNDFNLLIQNENKPLILAQKILDFISPKINCQIGIFHQISPSGKIINKIASYGFNLENSDSELLEENSLILQVFKDKKSIHLKNIESYHTKIESGIINTIPKEIYLIPCIVENNVITVLEIGSINKIDNDSLDLLNAIENSIALSMNSAFIQQKREQLLNKVSNQTSLLRQKQIDLNQAKQKIESASKNKSAFLEKLSYRLRTQLNNILGTIELLQRTTLNEDQFSHINILTKSTDNLIKSTNELLNISKIESGEIYLNEVEFNFIELISGVYEKYNPVSIEKGLILEKKFKHNNDELHLIGDLQKIDIVLSHIIENSINYSEKGKVIFSIEDIKDIKDKFHFHFEIKDEGIGINKNIIDEIFNNNELNNSYKFLDNQSIISLRICNNYLKLMGSKLNIDSSVGLGTTISFDLILEKSETKINEIKSVIDPELFNNYNILIAEDVEFNQIIAKKILKEWGINVDIASNGNEVLNKLKSNTYNAILMDIQMPLLNGIDTTIFIRNQLDENVKNIPIIALTANAYKEDIDNYLKIGMNDYVSKPFKANELFKCLKKHIIPNKKLFDLTLLKTMSKGNSDFAKKLIDSFIINSDEILKGFEESLKTNNFNNISNLAHKLKPAAITIEATDLKIILENIELFAKNEQLDELKNEIKLYTSLINEINNKLKNEI